MAAQETKIVADVGFVGSGVASAMMANQLAADGVRVAILEAGPKIDRGAALERYLSAPIKGLGAPYVASPDFPFPGSTAAEPWYDQAGPDPFKSTYLKAVGGTTWHWLGTTLRLVPDDFRMKTTFGIADDWPVTYADLEPWYQKAEEEFMVAGDPAQDLGSPRKKPYPLPPIPLSYIDKTFAAALKGTEFTLAATPQARLSKPLGNRLACCGSGSCVPLCPVAAKYDATVHLNTAVAAGARVVDLTTAVAVEIGAGQRVTAIRFKRPDGTDGRLEAKVFVLGANALEIPRLLLASRTDALPKGAANSSGLVGRNLMDHPVQLTWALARKAMWPYRGPLSTSGIDRFRRQNTRKTDAALRIEIFNSGWSWPTGAPATTAGKLAATGLRGPALAKAFRDHSARQVMVASMVEQLPDPANRVTLDPARRDKFGVPKPKLYYRVDDYVKRGQARARRLHAGILRRVGVTEIHHRDDFEGAGHIIGTTRMGDDPKSSVVDASLRSHDHPNLFLLGSGVFPTAATANPTLTIAALSLRSVAAVRETLRT